MTVPRPGPLENIAVARGFLQNAPELLMTLQRKHGNVVRFGFGRLSFTALFGVEANRFILSEHPENFTWREALQALITVDGDTALVVTDGPEHARRRRMVQPAFATRAINGYVEIMVDEADRELSTWRRGEELDIYEALRRVIRRIAIRTLFGDSLGDRAQEFGDALSAALDFVNKPMPLQIKVPIPGTGWVSARRGRDRADEIVNAEIARRRAVAPADDDLLDRLINAVDDEGGPALSDVEVRDQVVSLIAAGYDTTSAAAGWTVHELLHTEGEWKRAADEVHEVLGDAPLTVDHLQRMPHLDRVVTESLRLWPPGFISGRHVGNDFEFEGHTIKAGGLILYSPYVTGRLPELWDEPDRFDPDRWIDKEVDPYAFVPFGGGYRRCIGFAFATQELKVLLVELLRRVELTGLRPLATPTGVAAISPKGGVPVRILSVL